MDDLTRMGFTEEEKEKLIQVEETFHISAVFLGQQIIHLSTKRLLDDCEEE